MKLESATAPVAPGSAKARFLVVGTPGGAAVALAQALTELLNSIDAAFAASEGKALDLSLRDALSRPSVHIVVFVESPESALADWLSRGHEGSSAELLAQWHADARTLLRHWRGSPGRFLLLDADEAARAGQAIVPALVGWRPALRDLAALQLRDSRAAVDELLRLVAREVLRSNDEVTSLHKELEACCVALIPSEADPTDGRAHEAMARYREVHESNASLQREAADLRSKVEALRVEQQSMRSDAEQRIAALQAECSDARNQGDLLLAQIKDLQHEAGTQYLRAKGLEREVDESRAGTLPPMHTAEVRVTETVEAAPHRHLHFQISRARIGGRHFPKLQVRLVEHAGRPGLAIFDGADAVQALGAWNPSGREGERSFMLFVPGDDARRNALEHLGTSDWHFLISLARKLRHHLYTAPEAAGARWRTVAARLCGQLDDLPPRLRYDDLVVSDGRDAGLDVTLRNALFGSKPLGDARLRWHPSRRTIEWLAETKTRPVVALTSWPVDAAGLLQPADALPVGAGMGTLDKRRRLEAMSQSDRALLMAALDTLVAAARKAVGTSVQQAGVDLESAALALHQDASSSLWRLRARNLARRVLRRPSARS